MDVFPTAASVFGKFAESAIDKPLKRKLFLSLLNVFGVTDLAEENRRKMMSLAERGINPFDIHTVPNNFSGIYPEFSFSILFEKTADPIAQRAVKLVVAALQYRQSLLDNTLEKETSGNTVIDTSRHHHLFGRVVNVRKTGLKWTKDVKDCKNSSHIVVAVNGSYYKLDVIDSGGTVMAAESILQNISSIVRAAAQDRNSAKPYGVITANVARPSADVFYARELDRSIEIIDEAIFLLAIDDVTFPADENDAGQDLHIRNRHNRDYRKSFQLVVLQNGFSGATFSLFAGIEGVLATRFSSWIDSYARDMPSVPALPSQETFVGLEFTAIDFHKLPLAKLERRIAQYSCSLPLIKRIDVIGKDEIKRLKLSPDAFVHAAAHLAYYDKFKKIPSIHSFVDMRGIKFGSITRYLSTSNELVAFLKNPTKSSLINACEAHKKGIAAIKSGDNPLHYLFFYLYPSVDLNRLLAIALFRLFVPDLFIKHFSPDIWASNIPALPGIYCVGRFGIFFKTARKNCLAGHYLLFPDHIKTCFLSNERSFLESWHFDEALSDAMIKLKQILSAPLDDN